MAQIIQKTSGGCAKFVCIGIAFIFAAGGLLFNPLFLIVTGVFFICSLMIGKSEFVCSNCGNVASETSRMCPACKARIDGSPVRKFNPFWLIMFILVGLPAIAAGVLYWMRQTGHSFNF